MKCKGCGIQIQTENPKLPGYIDEKVLNNRLSENKEILCKNCFRTKHYGEFKKSTEDIHTINYISNIIKDFNNIIFLIDLSDFFGTFDKRIFNLLKNKKVIYVINKVDLFPVELSSEEIKSWAAYQLRTDKKNIYLISAKKNRGMDRVERAINKIKGKKVGVVGVTSVGKSFFINDLLDKKSVTTSKFPGTTMEPITLLTKNGIKIIDTPGIYTKNRLSDIMDDKSKGRLLPDKKIERTTIKCHRDMSVFISGFVKIEFESPYKRIPVLHIFTPENVSVHVTNSISAEEKWESWIPKILFPPYKEEKMDKYTYNESDYYLKAGEELHIAGLGIINMAYGELDFSLKLPENVLVKKTRSLFNKDKFK